MILYHYTSRRHLDLIINDRHLRVTESNLSMKREHAGPDVVWLTTKNEPYSAGHGLDGSSVDKREVRITVDVPKREVHKWRDWVTSRGISREWLNRLTAVGGSHSWRVVTRPIPSTEWVAVEDSRTGESLMAIDVRKDERA